MLILQEQLEKCEIKLIALYKEKDELEMKKMFKMVKENNMSMDDVIKAINVFGVKKEVDAKRQ